MTKEDDRRDMEPRIVRELSTLKRPEDRVPDDDALVAVCVGYLQHRTAPGFEFIDDIVGIVGKIVDIREQLAAAIVDHYLDGVRANVTRAVYRPQLRAAVDETLKQQVCDPGGPARDTLADLALGIWDEASSLRAARGPIAMMMATYYVWGSD